MAKIITLKDHKTNELAYPQTVSDAVYMDNGSTLEQYKESVSRQFANYPNVTVNGTVTNLPDNEDIRETEQHTLQLADRNNLEGMGYVILRKNKSFAEQVTEENTIYEIRYNFDLGGASVTIPIGCELRFAGGLVDNGSITIGNDTTIHGEHQIFGDNLSIVSSRRMAFCEWFGAQPDSGNDCSAAINKCLGAFSNVTFKSGVYTISNPVNLIKSGSATFTDPNFDKTIQSIGGTLFLTGSGKFYFEWVQRITMENLIMRVNNSVTDYVIDTVSCKNIDMLHLDILAENKQDSANLFKGIAIRAKNNGDVAGCWHRVKDCTISGSSLALHLDTSVGSAAWITSCVFENINIDDIKEYAIKLHGKYQFTCRFKNIVISSNFINDKVHYAIHFTDAGYSMEFSNLVVWADSRRAGAPQFYSIYVNTEFAYNAFPITFRKCYLEGALYNKDSFLSLCIFDDCDVLEVDSTVPSTIYTGKLNSLLYNNGRNNINLFNRDYLFNLVQSGASCGTSVSGADSVDIDYSKLGYAALHLSSSSASKKTIQCVIDTNNVVYPSEAKYIAVFDVAFAEANRVISSLRLWNSNTPLDLVLSSGDSAVPNSHAYRYTSTIVNAIPPDETGKLVLKLESYNNTTDMYVGRVLILPYDENLIWLYAQRWVYIQPSIVDSCNTVLEDNR